MMMKTYENKEKVEIALNQSYKEFSIFFNYLILSLNEMKCQLTQTTDNWGRMLAY